jgi:DNA polymerase
MHGQWLESGHAERTIATVHPSSILRAPDAEARAQQYAEFVNDLRVVAEAI